MIPGSVAENVSLSLETGLPLASVTAAVALLVEVPLATIAAGDSCTLTFLAVPAVWVKVVCPNTPEVMSVAVIVGVPALSELVSVAV